MVSSTGMSIVVASDHAGFDLKNLLLQDKEFVKNLGIAFFDCGCFTKESCDYPDIVLEAVEKYKELKKTGNTNVTILLICGSGIGVSIAANRYSFVRAALCHNANLAELARVHNDANCLCLGARFVSLEEAKKMITSFCTFNFEGQRHQKRVDKLSLPV